MKQTRQKSHSTEEKEREHFFLSPRRILSLPSYGIERERETDALLAMKPNNNTCCRALRGEGAFAILVWLTCQWRYLHNCRSMVFCLSV